MPCAGNRDFKVRQDLSPGLRLSVRSKRLGAYFSEIVIASRWYLDFVDFGNILLLAHACRPPSQRLGVYFLLFFRN